MSDLLPARSRLVLTPASARPTATLLERCDALLLVLREGEESRLAELPLGPRFAVEFSRLPRRAGTCCAFALPNARGTRVVVGVLAREADAFARLTLAGRVLREIAAAEPATVALAALGGSGARADGEAVDALLAALLARVRPLPAFRRTPEPCWAPREVVACGAADAARTEALESAAHLARWLTALPPNHLTPGSYRRRIAALARARGWRMQVYDEAALRRARAGAFLAVVQGSATRDAALVRLQYRPRRGRGAAQAPLALVGKGLCFDTGGTNLKPAKAMLDMHGDMAGSAVALGILDALTTLRYPRPVDAWLALAENRIGPAAYQQQDVVVAADGTTIQVVHTDAEGRMVLADSLVLAARSGAAAIVDFATLTGACVAALTERYSGVFTNRPALRGVLEDAGTRAGERVWCFPTPVDFDEDLRSDTADVQQCLIDGKGDHIYAARFLSRFVPPGLPWVHCDLSSAHRSGGLAHVATAITGFGVRFGVTLLEDPAFLGALAPPDGRAVRTRARGAR